MTASGGQFVGTSMRLPLETIDSISGACGGAMGVVLGHPLDTIRIRLQQPAFGYGGVVGAMRAIVANEGFSAMFKGVTYPLVCVAAQNGVTFGAYGFAQRLLSTGSSLREQPLSYYDHFRAGCFAGGVQTLVATPQELLKIRQQVQTARIGSREYMGPRQMLLTVLRSEGIRGLYRGQMVTLVRDVPSYGLYFMTYEWLRNTLEPNHAVAGGCSSLVTVFAGGIAGSLGWLSVYPIDVVKSRVQAQSLAAPATAHLSTPCAAHPVQQHRTASAQHSTKPVYASSGTASVLMHQATIRASQSVNTARVSGVGLVRNGTGLSGTAVVPDAVASVPVQYRSAWHCAVEMYRKEGIRSFFRGCTATLVRAFFSNGMIFLGYSLASSSLRELNGYT